MINVHFGSDHSNVYKLLVDTDSGYLTVTSSQCGVQCWRHPKYDHSKSKTYKPDGRSVEWDIGEFQFFGSLSVDSIGLIQEGAADFQINNVTFAELIKSSDGLEESTLDYDGFLGLSLVPEYDANRVFAFPSLMSYIMKQGLVQSNIFSLYLSEILNPDQKNQKGKGALVLGGYSSDYYEGPMNFYPIPSNAKHWSFEFDGLKVNGKPVTYLSGCGYGTGTKCVGILSSGDFNIITDTVTFSNMQLFANVSIPADCSQVQLTRIPTFTFVIGGNEYSIKPQDFVIENKPPIWGSALCQGAITGADGLDQGTWIFGSVFQSLFYTVYDQQNGRIGLAKAKHN